ncbi:ATP-binding cassette subfamily C protein [Blastomonas natatoria]|uniref:ATP-binding cassette subfamily C protein n=1 Tax=Blastomonas natatoria TaxID=34015 RepID=A0A2V3V0T3_9SPHN|nr:ABC transporter ATP-binding protein [Blastomonas natatoria]PXW74561.1 ATP-binding cassette subfamily C protein [Blastomonas natatoria]
MPKALSALAAFLARVPPGSAAGVLLLTITASATEGVGIVLLVQLLSVIGGALTDNVVVSSVVAVLAYLGIPATAEGLLGAFVSLIALQSVVGYARDQSVARLQFDFADGLRQDCFEALLSAEWRWIAPHRPADLANLMLVEMNRVGLGVQSGLALLAAVAAALAYLGAALVIASGLTLVVLVSSGVILLALARVNREAYALGQLQVSANRSLLQTLQDSIGSIKLAKVLGNERRHLSRVKEAVAEVRDAQLSFARNSSLSRALFQVCGAALLALYVYLGLKVLAVPLPELLTLVIVFARLMPLLMNAQQQGSRCINMLPAFAEVSDFLAASRAARQADVTSEPRPVQLAQAIELLDVTLAYPGRDRPALEAVSVTIEAGKITAIMGPSGAGKSSLADIIIGLITPDAGQLLVDGKPVSGADRQGWMRTIAYMPQEIFLFPGTIRENLFWARPGADEASLVLALRQASADFVLDLPEGLDTQIGQAGAGLSGGERQRIALARALLQQPVLLILDEATSALDAANSARILEAVAALRGSTTVVLIGHTPAAAVIADQVLVMLEGRLAAAGPWAQVSDQLAQTG